MIYDDLWLLSNCRTGLYFRETMDVHGYSAAVLKTPEPCTSLSLNSPVNTVWLANEPQPSTTWNLHARFLQNHEKRSHQEQAEPREEVEKKQTFSNSPDNMRVPPSERTVRCVLCSPTYRLDFLPLLLYVTSIVTGTHVMKSVLFSFLWHCSEYSSTLYVIFHCIWKQHWASWNAMLFTTDVACYDTLNSQSKHMFSTHFPVDIGCSDNFAHRTNLFDEVCKLLSQKLLVLDQGILLICLFLNFIGFIKLNL